MTYSAYDDSDFSGLPENEFRVIPLLRSIISKKALDSSGQSQYARDKKHAESLKMIAKNYPFIGLDCVHWDTTYSEFNEEILYYIKLTLP